MKNLLKSAAFALLLLVGFSTVSQAQGMYSNYTYVQGTFSSPTRTLPFKSFRATVYDYTGYSSVSGTLYSYSLAQLDSMRATSVCFSGRVNSRGVLTGTFRYNGKDYNITGSYNKRTGATIGSVTPNKKSNRVGQMIGREFVPPHYSY
jgi:hypothetical protein